MTAYSYMARHWRGELSLGTSFWFNLCVPFTLALVIRNWWVEILRWTGSAYSIGGVWVLTLGMLLLCSVIATWQVVGVWRSAANTPESRTSPIAKTATLFYALLLLPNLLFLVLGLREVDDEDFRVKEWSIERTGYIVTIRGYLEYGIADAFLAQIVEGETLIVALDSIGGIIQEANTIAEAIQVNKFTTVIMGECLSACTTIFAAGDQRIMLSQANIGFHSTRTLFTQDSVVDLEQARLHYEPLLARGFPPEMIEQVLATPPDEMWYPSTMQLLNSEFITGIASNMDDAVSILGLGDTTTNPPPYSAEGLARRAETANVSLLFSEGVESQTDIPIPSDLVVVSPENRWWGVFESMTTSNSRLLLVLIPASDVDLLESGEQELRIFARVEQIQLGTQFPENQFGQFREYMIKTYRERMSEILEKLPPESQRGDQRLSQTTLSDVRRDEYRLISFEVLDNTDNALVVELEMVFKMIVDGEPFQYEQVCVQSIIYIGGALIVINWYETKDIDGNVHDVHSRAKEMRRLLGKPN